MQTVFTLSILPHCLYKSNMNVLITQQQYTNVTQRIGQEHVLIEKLQSTIIKDIE